MCQNFLRESKACCIPFRWRCDCSSPAPDPWRSNIYAKWIARYLALSRNPPSDCDGRGETTNEGLEDPVTGELNPLQKAFVDNSAFQCGFCTPGIIMSAKALLDNNPCPTDDEIMESLSGNYSRCISYYQGVEAIHAVIEKGRS